MAIGSIAVLEGRRPPRGDSGLPGRTPAARDRLPPEAPARCRSGWTAGLGEEPTSIYVSTSGARPTGFPAEPQLADLTARIMSSASTAITRCRSTRSSRAGQWSLGAATEGAPLHRQRGLGDRPVPRDLRLLAEPTPAAVDDRVAGADLAGGLAARAMLNTRCSRPGKRSTADGGAIGRSGGHRPPGGRRGTGPRDADPALWPATESSLSGRIAGSAAAPGPGRRWRTSRPSTALGAP